MTKREDVSSIKDRQWAVFFATINNGKSSKLL